MEVTEDLKKYVMENCDVKSLLQSWGVRPKLIKGAVWKGYCPEHYLHSCEKQVKPNWFMNVKNGDCVCFDNCVVNNIVYIAKRRYKLHTIGETLLLLTSGEWKNIK